ncbi:hypothetical protein BOX15_Mlig019376g2 [Macrostomum lignano]|uniref:EF-hand domain-containing protein n=2 Tax=Macrostomum lignano TaxID=282301 RepID=A0A267H063_9PLAT|nr:hypothetical protein BOX15_Mlig019376g2 [Macrostomum lignano]
MDRQLSASTESLLTSRSRSLFDNLDRDCSGYIEPADLADYCGAELSKEEFAKLFKELDKDGDGRISLEDFREGFRFISRTVHRHDQERRRSSVASSLSARRLPTSTAGSRDDNLNRLDESVEEGDGSRGAAGEVKEATGSADTPQQQLAQALNDCLQSLSTQDCVLDLYQQLSEQQQRQPHLLESFETVLADLIQTIQSLRSEQTKMEESMKLERQRHRRALREMEAELEQQLAAAEEAAHTRARESAERDFRAVLEAKDAELASLAQQLAEHRVKLTAADSLGSEIAALKRELTEARAETQLAQSELNESETRLAVAMSEISSLKQSLQEREFSVARERETVQEQLRQGARIAQQLQAMHAANRALRDRNEELLQVAKASTSSSFDANEADHGEESDCDDANEHDDVIVDDRRNRQKRLQIFKAPSTAPRTGSSRLSGNRQGLKVGGGHPERMFKVVLAGDSSVGKSCLIMRLCDNKFVERTTATLGVDFKTTVLNVDGEMLAVQLWDTAGQERFRSIAKSYFRRADGVLLLYDCSHERSFLSVRDWLSQVREAADVPIMICGNKIDLRAEAELKQRQSQDSQQNQRFVGYTEARKLAQEHDALFAETSAKSGENVAESVAELARQMRANEDLQVSQAHSQLSWQQQSVQLKEGSHGSSRPACCET